jgi:hypothetical protein
MAAKNIFPTPACTGSLNLNLSNFVFLNRQNRYSRGGQKMPIAPSVGRDSAHKARKSVSSAALQT